MLSEPDAFLSELDGDLVFDDLLSDEEGVRRCLVMFLYPQLCTRSLMNSSVRADRYVSGCCLRIHGGKSSGGAIPSRHKPSCITNLGFETSCASLWTTADRLCTWRKFDICVPAIGCVRALGRISMSTPWQESLEVSWKDMYHAIHQIAEWVADAPAEILPILDEITYREVRPSVHEAHRS